MIRPFFAAALALATLSPSAGLADGYAPGYAAPRFPHPHSHGHQRPLPPEIAYRDEAFEPGFADGPTLVDDGPPRSLALPLYNEPPPRFPAF